MGISWHTSPNTLRITVKRFWLDRQEERWDIYEKVLEKVSGESNREPPRFRHQTLIYFI
jgi:hypothetical protein